MNMAKIKLAGSGRKVSRELPAGAVPSTSGIAERATQSLAGAVLQLGGTIQEKHLIAKSNQEAEDGMAKLRAERNRTTRESNELFAGTDYETYSDNNTKLLSEKSSELSDQITTSRGKRLFKLKSTFFQSSAKAQWDSDERVQNLNFLQSEDDRIRSLNKRGAADSLSLDEAAELLRSDLSSRPEKLGTVHNSNSLLKVQGKDYEYATSVLDMMEVKGGASLIEGKNFLDGKIEKNNLAKKELLSTMSTGQIARYSKRFDRAIERQVRANEDAAITVAKNTENFVELERRLSGRFTLNAEKAVLDSYERLKLLPQTPRISQEMNKLVNIAIVNHAKDRLLQLNVPEVAKPTDETIKDIMEMTRTNNPEFVIDNLEAQKSIEKAVLEIKAEIIEDPGGIAKRSSPYPEGSQAFVNWQKDRGYSPKTASVQTMRTELSLFENSTDPVDALNNFKTKFKQWPKVLSEMSGVSGKKSASIMAPYVIASEFTDKNTQNALLRADIKAAKKIHEQKTVSSGWKLLRDRVSKEVVDITNAMGPEIAFKNDLVDRLTAITIARMETGAEQGDAVKFATSMVRRELSVAEVGSSKILITQKDKDKNKTIKTDLEALMEVFLKEGDLFISPENLTKLTGITPEANIFLGKGEERFWDTVRQGMVFRLNSRRDGYNIVYTDPTNIKGPKALKARDENGNISKFTISKDEISRSNSLYSEIIIHAQTPEDRVFKGRREAISMLRKAGVPEDNLPKFNLGFNKELSKRLKNE